MKNLELHCTIILVAWTLLIVILERIFPYRRGLPIFREGFWVDLVWYTLIQSFVLKIVIFDWIIYPLDQRWSLSEWKLLYHWPLWAQVAFFLVTHDLYIYWFHRWQHRNKILWRTHEAHHSVKEVDWLAGSRSHSLEILINQTIEFAPIVLLGARPEVVPIKALLDACWGMFIHANLRINLGPFKYVLNGPEMHLWHHADELQVYHRNFATKLSLWDWIFNTAYLPGRQPLKWGLWYPFPKDYFLQHAYAFWRFDFRRLEENPRWQWYFAWRQQLMNAIKQIIKSSYSPDNLPVSRTHQKEPAEAL
ncbi:MAG: sterol desaturase family protein [Flavobacteriales bacterium]|nr:sterol desaturase family protein [Flavobacteriales bacterium]MCX7767483.1 sterol desaturase family protein [Flavobacteriales bacterium]MDW8409619.1 sterol desaturase family protein [Flavobacteriales bacterium]